MVISSDPNPVPWQVKSLSPDLGLGLGDVSVLVPEPSLGDDLISGFCSALEQ